MQITNEAKQFLQEMMSRKDVETVRFFFAGMGCGTPQMGVRLEEAQPKDHVSEVNGVKVAIDPTIKDQTENITLDFEEREGSRSIVLHGLDSCC
ncbi:iron-sulfur cluster biosynthesis family protein [Alteribacter aurantiacus]|uniref:iron-sulfur cluster biosynthesis family protein n=1 Tax=Alteribacter aurantiacus TaxID=254410 RepID=UPI0004081231|nr:iron-sulfur cluster biosynthesis family protein [Alteribacter aurantiacus]